MRPASAGTGSPSSALSARSSDTRMHVKLGVSRSVYADASVAAQLLHEVEERADVVGVERDDELLVVEAEGVRRVVVDLRVLGARS